VHRRRSCPVSTNPPRSYNPATSNTVSGQLHGSTRHLQPQSAHSHVHASTWTMLSTSTILYRSVKVPQSKELLSPTLSQTQAQFAPTPSLSPLQTTLFFNEPYSRAQGPAIQVLCNSLIQFFAPWNRTFSPHPLGTALHSNIDPPPTTPKISPTTLQCTSALTAPTSILTPMGTKLLPPFLPDCRATIRQHIVVAYTNFPIVPPIFSYLTFDFPEDETTEAQPHGGIILTLRPIIARRHGLSATLILHAQQPAPLNEKEETLRRGAFLTDFLTMYSLPSVNLDNWILLDHAIILHLLSPPLQRTKSHYYSSSQRQPFQRTQRTSRMLGRRPSQDPTTLHYLTDSTNAP